MNIVFTQWLHDKFCKARTPSKESCEALVNAIIINDLDVDIVNLDQMYDDILKYLHLNAKPELVVFFRKCWFEYRKFMDPLEQKLKPEPVGEKSK